VLNLGSATGLPSQQGHDERGARRPVARRGSRGSRDRDEASPSWIHHSLLKAVSGSSRDARRAGTSAATSATATTTPATTR
jgi:hypothetical protein